MNKLESFFYVSCVPGMLFYGHPGHVIVNVVIFNFFFVIAVSCPNFSASKLVFFSS